MTRYDGTEFFKGQTPAVVTLDVSAKFFKRERYAVKFSKPGYDDAWAPVVFHIDGWYWGNLLLGGAIGMLIVDPATGAMYKLRNPVLNQTLSQKTASLQVLDINEIPMHWKDELVELNKYESR